MKVVLLANTAWYLNNFRRTTVNSLLQEGHDVVLVCPNSSGEHLLADVPCEVSTFALDNAGTNPASEVGSLIQIHKILRKEKPDLVFSFNPKTNLYGLMSCRLLGITCIPNVSGVGNASQLVGWKAIAYKLVSRIAFRSAHHVFFQNESDLQSYKELGVLRADRFSCLPGSGVDLDRFQPSVKPANKSFVFLLACRLITQKGVIEYLQAAEKLKAGGHRCEFWLAGVPDNSQRAVPDSVIADFEERGIIRFLGNVSNMESVLADVCSVVLPSWYPEGVPRILLEGAAAGKPLITTDRPGCRDVVVDERNGFYVEAGSVNSLVDAMEKVLELPADKLDAMGKASRALAESVFDERQVIREYLKFAESSDLWE